MINKFGERFLKPQPLYTMCNLHSTKLISDNIKKYFLQGEYYEGKKAKLMPRAMVNCKVIDYF